METLHRLFFALRPPARQARLIGLVRDAIDGAQHRVANEQLHITLGITDDYRILDTALIDRMMAIGDTIEGEPVEIRLDRLSASTRSVALRPTGQPRELTELQRQIARLIEYWALTRTGWTFNPHLTLLHWTGQPFIRAVTPVEWLAEELVLVHGLVGEGRQIVLGRWPLVARQHSLSLV